jgi:phenylacetate-CoA ligase
MSPDELAALNLERRRELVRFASAEVPFYREKYRGWGFEPGDVDADGFFEKLPILEKEEIRENAETLLASGCDLKRLRESTTGGSTGLPLKTYHDPAIPADVLSWRMLNWWGVDVSENSGYLYRAVPEGPRKVLQRIALWPTKRNWISAADMSEENMSALAQALIRDKAKYLVG